MGGQAVPVDQKFVSLGFTAEDGMIVEYEAGFARSSVTLEDERRGQAADAAAHQHAVVDFSSFDYVLGKRLEVSIADSMPSLKDRRGVAVGSGVLANTAVAGPVIFHALRVRLEQFEGRGRSQKQATRSQQRSIEKVPAGDDLRHPQRFFRPRVLPAFGRHMGCLDLRLQVAFVSGAL